MSGLALALPAALLPKPRALAQARKPLFALALPGAFQSDHRRRYLPRRAAFLRKGGRDGSESRHDDQTSALATPAKESKVKRSGHHMQS